MAGDWIKWTKGLTRKREVLLIASELEIKPEEAASRVMLLWEWCDDNITAREVDVDGNASVTLGAQQDALIDAITGIQGFALAMQNARWLKRTRSTITFPNFARHNGTTAKTRALTQKRVKRSRNGCVTPDALPEKRREEKSIKKENTKRKNTGFIRPTIDQVNAYCQERNNGIDGQNFIDHYDRVGWVVGRNKTAMKDWKAAVRLWEQSRRPVAPSSRIASSEDLAGWSASAGANQ